jgi:hypothetical protein
LPDVRRGEAVRDRGRLAPVRRVELAQDVRHVDAGGPDTDDELRGTLTVGVAAGEEGQDLRLAWGQTEGLLQALPSLGWLGLRRRELEPRALGKQLEPFS